MKLEHSTFVDKISEILVEMKVLKTEDIVPLHRAFRDVSNITFEDFLLEEGLVEKPDLLQALSRYYQVPFMDVIGAIFDHVEIQLVPKNVMIRNLFIPYERQNDNLIVVAANPNDPNLRSVIGQYLSHRIEFMVGLPSDIINTIREFYDESITYQPDEVQNQQMERSQIDVHPIDELKQEGHSGNPIPTQWQNDVDDYESK